MPSPQNIQALQELTEQIKDTKAFILVDYAGMDVDTQTQLRDALRETGATYTIAKNTLVRLALKDILSDQVPDQLKQALEGPTAILFAPDDDPVSPAKALQQFIEENEAPSLKIGFMDDKVLTVTQIEELAKLPGQQELLGQLAAQLNAPITGFAQVLRANLQNLVFALKAIEEQKQADQ